MKRVSQSAIDGRTTTGLLMLTAIATLSVTFSVPAFAASSGQSNIESYVDTELLPGQLVVNGDAETGSNDGWVGVLAVYQHGVGGYPAAVLVNSSGLTGETYDGGGNLFVGVGAASLATQSIDLAPASAAIDNAHSRARISAYLGGYTTQGDNMTLRYDFLDAAGVVQESRQFGPVLPEHRGADSGFVYFDDVVPLPPGVRAATITLLAATSFGVSDAYADNIELRLETPAATAAAATGEVEAGNSVLLTPLMNSAPGAGAQLVPGSLRLLENGAAQTQVTSAEGTWQVDMSTGEVLFTADGDFQGTTVPMRYQVADTSGQKAEGDLTVEVAERSPQEGIVMPPVDLEVSDPVLTEEPETTLMSTDGGKIQHRAPAERLQREGAGTVLTPEEGSAAPVVDSAVSSPSRKLAKISQSMTVTQSRGSAPLGEIGTAAALAGSALLTLGLALWTVRGRR